MSVVDTDGQNHDDSFKISLQGVMNNGGDQHERQGIKGWEVGRYVRKNLNRTRS